MDLALLLGGLLALIGLLGLLGVVATGVVLGVILLVVGLAIAFAGRGRLLR